MFESQQVGDEWIDEDCSTICHCNDGALECREYGCSEFAKCKVEDGVRDCYCLDGFDGDGELCTRGRIFSLLK